MSTSSERAPDPPHLPSGISPPGGRIRALRQRFSLSQKDFAERVGLSQSTLSQIENDRYNPSYATIAYLAHEFDVDGNWLLRGTGDFQTSSPGGGNQFGFPAVHEKALAGYKGKDRDDRWLSELDRYLVPGFRQDADIVIFETLGDSMEPTIVDQDFVLGERILESPENCVGQCVVCVTEEEVIIKRLASFDLATSRLTLSSDNPKYKSEEFDWSKIFEFWLVVGRITRALAPSFLNQEQRIRQLEGSIQELTDAHQELRGLILDRHRG